MDYSLFRTKGTQWRIWTRTAPRKVGLNFFSADLGMTEEDTLLLMLVTLFTQDSPSGSAKNGEKIDLAKKYFVDKMMDHMEKRRAGSAPEGLLLLPMLRSIKNSFMEVLTSLSVR